MTMYGGDYYSCLYVFQLSYIFIGMILKWNELARQILYDLRLIKI